MKTLLCLPKGTPTTILLHETGNIPLEYTIKTRTILQAKRIDQMKEESLIKYITKTETSLWKKKHRGNHQRIPCIRANDHINQIRLEDPDQEAKFAEEIENDAEWKPNINHWLARRRNTKIGTRPKRMETLNRKQCSAILRARASMLKVKPTPKSLWTKPSVQILPQNPRNPRAYPTRLSQNRTKKWKSWIQQTIRRRCRNPSRE